MGILRGAWWALVHGIPKTLDRTEQLHFYFLSTKTDMEIRCFRNYPTHSCVITGVLSDLSLIYLPYTVIFWLEMLGEALTVTIRPRQAPEWLFSWVILQEKVLVRNMELRRHHQLGEFRKGQKDIPHVLQTSQNPPGWNPSWLSNACTTRKDPESERWTRDNLETDPVTIKPCGWTVLLGSLTLMLSAQASFANTVSCFVSSSVSSDNSFLSVRQEPIPGP